MAILPSLYWVMGCLGRRLQKTAPSAQAMVPKCPRLRFGEVGSIGL